MHPNVQQWLQEPFDLETRLAVQKLLDTDPQELEDAFSSELSFGTGGLRGIMGVGPNRMNRYTVRNTTQGLAQYLHTSFPEESIRVVIGFDNRLHSEEFAQEACEVLLKNGIDVFFIESLRPTPFLSFACRHYQAHAAIMITASHNPKEYNGYKVYWQDGGQVVPPHDIGIMNAVRKHREPTATKRGTYHPVPPSLDMEYCKAIRPLQHFPLAIHAAGSDLKIVFTSLHGTGITLAPLALRDWGFSQILPVQEQVIVDGTFPTVSVPNPEYPAALKLGIDLMLSAHADILFATDPDADRLAVAIRTPDGPFILTGNQVAVICAEFLCRFNKNPSSALITSIVSTDLLDEIATKYKLQCLRVLTGFKYIAEKIHEWESLPESPSFLFGAEESCGYLYGTHCRDKDAIVTCCLMAEIALICKRMKCTLRDLLYEIYESYGVFAEKLLSINFTLEQGGIHAIQKLMDRLRHSPPTHIADHKISKIKDYLLDTTLPKSDILTLFLEGGSRLTIRPSGTEPKLKIYAAVRFPAGKQVRENLIAADHLLDSLLASCKDQLQKES